MLNPVPEQRSLETLLSESNRLRQRRPSDDANARAYDATRQPAAKIANNALKNIIGAAAGKPSPGLSPKDARAGEQMHNISLA